MPLTMTSSGGPRGTVPTTLGRMRTPGSPTDPSSWVTLHENRPPRVLELLFWGAVALTLGLYALLFLSGQMRFHGGDPVANTAVLVSVGVLLLCCALWPFLAWSPVSPWPRRAVSAVFLALTVLCMLSSNHTTFLLLCVGTMNAVAVFGLPGGVGYGSAVLVFSVGLTLVVPDLPFAVGLFAGVILLFIVAASGTVFLGLTVAARRAEHTRELLAALEEAHGELRRRSDRIRELTVAEERARMSREMHDSTGHYLTALTMSLSNALRFRTARPDSAWEEVRQARELAREALTDTRRWVRALRPLGLEGRAGLAAMRAMAASFDGGGVRIRFAVTGDGVWPDLSEEAELVCYRALQEGLTNAMRHSGADLIEVEVLTRAEGVAVTVTDNGGGAGKEAVRAGFGLRGLSERVAAVGGTMLSGNVCAADRAREAATPGSTPPADTLGFRLRAEVPARAGTRETVPGTAGGTT
ncbi:Sensor protein degS [Nocardiopsis dassonvillei]|uniref:histidine kinase n=3 Tax=Nocardiopsidaceae TaxID=83676 RepID=D7AWY4_NOCDD|nr:integral membrane sensor signal transduction histidine kinase [Nocardiopsis dassonvillei subsp. dassonvillei DSM 43111]VEI90266.1 Sensor protein degS [Nocardiopsis dassonvillei]